MAYTTINKSSSFMNTKLHSGTGSTTTITGVGFQPDWTWFKSRSNANNHALYDAVRGASKLIRSNSGTAEQTNTALSAFTSDGVTLTGGDSFTNASGYTYASWNWKAGGGQGSSNTDGSINTTYTSVNTTAGFSICKWTGSGSNATIGHGLGAVPKMIIFKNLNTVTDWDIYHGSLANTERLHLNSSGAKNTAAQAFNSTSPTTSVFSVGTADNTNKSSSPMIAYCFAEKTGYSKFGSYIGNGNANGPFVYTGFKPAFVMFKCSSNASSWGIYDNKRVGYNEVKNVILPNDSATENTDLAPIDLLSNGFKMRRNDSANDQNNKGGATYIYMAFGQSIVGSNNIPATAR